jgi:outer membrane lipoprotein SlyB
MNINLTLNIISKIRSFMKYFIVCALISSSLLSACATGPNKPRFYPNDYYRRVGGSQAEMDSSQCMAMADQYSQDPSRWQEAAKSGLGGAVVGAGVGAVGGVITKGSVGRTTAAGAAIGSLIGVASELSKIGEKSPSYERFVEHCLQMKGYEIIGWGK